MADIATPIQHPLFESAAGFQREDHDFLTKRKRVVLSYETGLGKTYVACMRLASMGDLRHARILVLGSKSSMDAWQRIPYKWLGMQVPVLEAQGLTKDRKPAEAAFDAMVAGKPFVLAMTYNMFLARVSKSVKTKDIDILTTDEFHRKMRTRTQTWQHIHFAIHSDDLWGLTATWTSRGPQELWPYLNLINPHTFPSYWAFVNTYCEQVEGQFGREIIGPKNVPGLKDMLRRYTVRRTWEVVRPDMPPVRREGVYVRMKGKQRKLYDQIDTEMMAIDMDTGDSLVVGNVMTVALRLRQMTICPSILFPDIGYGAVIDWVTDKVVDEPHTVIFTPFTDAFEWIRRSLQEAGLPHDNIYELRGGMSVKEVSTVVTQFKERRGTVICTISFAESFDLSSVSYAIMAGFEWDPQQNTQAEGRLRRYDSTIKDGGQVVYYVMCEDSIDVNGLKAVNNNKVYSVQQYMVDKGKLKYTPEVPKDFS